jgi:hypothetical protein
MIPPGHVHVMVPYTRLDRPDGNTEILSRCVCQQDPQTGVVISQVEQRHIISPDGRSLGLHLRVGGVWFDPNDLLRAASHLQTCPLCTGVAGVLGEPCGVCGDLGVLNSDGGRITAPGLRVAG